MDKRVKERRRSVRRERGRRRAGVIVAGVAIVVALSLFLWLRSSDVFAVERITTTPVAHVTSEQIASATAASRGESLLALSVGPIEETLIGLPYVRSARVVRRFPNTLEVQVMEHVAVARLQAPDGSTWLVSDDGRLLEKKKDGTLPLFVPEGSLELKPGKQLPDYVAAALPLAAMFSRSAEGSSEESSEGTALPALERVRIALTGEVVADLQGDMELRLGVPTELKQKLTVAGTIIKQYLRDGRQIVYVDASVPDRVAVNAE